MLHPWRFLWLLAGCLAMLMVAGCSRPTPEQALRQSISDLQAAIEARDAKALQAHLAQDFIGPEGMDREGALRLARLVFLRNRSIGATLGPLEVALQGNDATVRFTAGLTGGSGSLLPDTAQVYEVSSGWRSRDGDWELVSVDWKPRL